MIAAQHGIDIVPIYVSGTHDAMPPGQNWPKRKPGRLLSRRHQVEVRFGEPIRSRDEQHRREVMDEVRAFWERKGLPAQAAASGAHAHDVLLIHARALGIRGAPRVRAGGCDSSPACRRFPSPSGDRSTSAA